MKYQYITIEREYASGGQEIGQKLAETLDIPCYGREILDIAAGRHGTTAEYLEHLEETATNSFLYSLFLMGKGGSGENGLTGTGTLNLAEENIINELALRGPAVFIGRCACHALQKRKNVLSVFIHADAAYRRKRAEEVYGDDPKRVEAILRQFDKRRANYYNASTGKKWADGSNYHIALNSGRFGIENCVEILKAAVNA